jgi:hypothetical protein
MSNRFFAARLSASFCFSWLRNSTRCASIAALLVVAANVGLAMTGRAADKVTVKVVGEVVPQCAISRDAEGAQLVGLGNADLPEVSRPGQKDFYFVVNCNAPFQYRLEAQYGALTQNDAGPVGPGLATSVPYDVAMHIPTDGATIDDRCAGESIHAGQVRCPFSSSGEGIAIGSRGRLTVAWSAAAGIPIAGAYEDNIKLTVGVRQ